MELFKEIIEWLFGTALLINSILFIPQAIKIFKTKSTQGVSLITFLGFLLIQLAVLLHGVTHQDYMLTIGYLLSIITCSMVVILILYYQKSGEQLNIQEVFAQLPAIIYWKNKQGISLGCNSPTHNLFPTEIDQNIIQTGKTKIIEEQITTVNHELKHYLSYQSPLTNHNKEIIGIVGIYLDITETKKITLERLELLENIIALMPGHVYWVNQQGFYLGCNDNQAKSAGLDSRKEIIGKKNSDLPWNFNAGMLPEALDKINQEVIKTGNTILLEEPAVLKDGTELIFLSNKVPIRNQTGSIIGMVGISIDITARKKAEAELLLEKTKAETANKAKTEFLENMRHDIRTSLTGIAGLSELLKNETDKNKIEYFTTHLAKSSHELLRFLNEVLESIQVASGEIPLLNKKFNLKEILENVVKLHHPIAIKKQLSLKLQIDKAIPKYLIGDPVRIYRILLELLANALKFTVKGHITIFAKLGKREDQTFVVKIFVEDTGIGIPYEKQQDLFVCFKRLTPSYEGIYKGRGLGLSIVKQFLEDLKGEIYVLSSLNKGSKFVCIIPLKVPLLIEDPFKDNIPFTVIQTNHKTQQTKQTAKRYGLVVEDQPIAALVAKTLFIKQGCEIDVAESGAAALNQVQKHQYDFIVMDIGLPDIDGYEVTRNIRLFEESSQHRTFIAGLTAHGGPENNQRGLDAGMNIVLTKPLTQEMVVNLIKITNSGIF